MTVHEEIKKILYCDNYEAKSYFDMDFAVADILAIHHQKQEKIFFFNWDNLNDKDFESLVTLNDNTLAYSKKKLKPKFFLNSIVYFSFQGFNDEIKNYVRTTKSLRLFLYLIDFKNDEIVKLEKLGFVSLVHVSMIVKRTNTLLSEILNSCKNLPLLEKSEEISKDIQIVTVESTEEITEIKAPEVQGKEKIHLEKGAGELAHSDDNLEYENLCQNCRKEKPVIKRKFKKQLNLLFLVKEDEYEKVLCDECAKKIGSEYNAYTAVAGWWGVLFFMNPFYIIGNIINMNKKGVLKKED